MNKIILKAADVISDAFVVFCSYVLAVVIRYRVMEVEPGIEALSAPYLLVAVLYSISLSAALFVSHASEKYLYRAYEGGTLKDFYLNTIACLLLLSFFYIAGIGYFSRLAMVLFWMISTIAIYCKKMVFRRILNFIRRNGKNKIHVLVIGEGTLAEQYMKSIVQMPELGTNIIGYLSNSNSKNIVIELGCGGQKESVVRCIGQYADCESIAQKNDINEIIIATEENMGSDLKRVIEYARSKDIRLSIIPSFSYLLSNKIKVKEVGETKMICLDGSTRPKTALVFGLIVCVLLLLTMLVLRVFPLVDSSMSRVSDYEAYKSVVIGCMCMLMNLLLYSPAKKGVFRSVMVSAGICFCSALVYNVVFNYANGGWIGIQEDIVAVIGVSVVCFILGKVNESIRKDDTPLLL